MNKPTRWFGLAILAGVVVLAGRTTAQDPAPPAIPSTERLPAEAARLVRAIKEVGDLEAQLAVKRAEVEMLRTVIHLHNLRPSNRP
jgi:hypothetical protein